MQLVVSWSAADPDAPASSVPWANVWAQIRFNEADGAKVVTDDTGKSWGRILHVSGIDAFCATGQKKFGTASLYNTNKDTGYEIENYAAGAPFASGATPWTIECWFYKLSTAETHSFVSQMKTGTNAWQHFGVNPSEKLTFQRGSAFGSDAVTLTSTTALSTSAWHHCAVDYDGTTLRLFLNGVLEASAAATNGWVPTDAPLEIGRAGPPDSTNWSARNGFNGYLDDLRIVTGVSVYGAYAGSGFAVPTAEPTAGTAETLTADTYWSSVVALFAFSGTNGSTTITDAKGHTVTNTGGATLSDSNYRFGPTGCVFSSGSSDYFDVADSSDFAFGTGDFTIEFWCKPGASVPAWSRIAENIAFDSATMGWHISFNGSDSAATRRIGFQLSKSGGGGARIDSDAGINQYMWTHVAIVRSGDTATMFINGKAQAATMSLSGKNMVAQKLRVGANTGTPGNYYGGYLDCLRLTKGVARYTANFTVPYLPFPAA